MVAHVLLLLQMTNGDNPASNYCITWLCSFKITGQLTHNFPHLRKYKFYIIFSAIYWDLSRTNKAVEGRKLPSCLCSGVFVYFDQLAPEKESSVCQTLLQQMRQHRKCRLESQNSCQDSASMAVLSPTWVLAAQCTHKRTRRIDCHLLVLQTRCNRWIKRIFHITRITNLFTINNKNSSTIKVNQQTWLEVLTVIEGRGGKH